VRLKVEEYGGQSEENEMGWDVTRIGEMRNAYNNI
jgi:hypothetical protein